MSLRSQVKDHSVAIRYIVGSLQVIAKGFRLANERNKRHSDAIIHLSEACLWLAQATSAGSHTTRNTYLQEAVAELTVVTKLYEVQ
jgi:hypothetical protein